MRIEDGVAKLEDLCIKVFASRRDTRIPSVFWIWKSIDSQERESYDMLGICYDNRPRLKCILMPESWMDSPYEKSVQEAVDTLLDNGIRGQSMRDGHNKIYKSFSDVIEGKEGRFHETLLGKRVDYSRRSVIVVGPSISSNRC
uniref:NADH:ubiquinone oxidoreductase 30kDa subunit domain-containing protein n=1 Tax=Solanum lycopersicum TaxID=4081 RepID=A0A3Q7ECE6_SOLLC